MAVCLSIIDDSFCIQRETFDGSVGEKEESCPTGMECAQVERKGDMYNTTSTSGFWFSSMQLAKMHWGANMKPHAIIYPNTS